MKIPLNKVVIDPDRQRKDLGSVEEDLQSMADPEVGLVEPIIVERMLDGSYNLIAGERRTRKARFLGWTDIEAVERTGIDDLTRQKIEFVENVERKDLVWQEKCLAVFKLYKLENRLRKLRGDAAFSIRAMASFSGYTKSSIGYMIQIGDALNRTPQDAEMWATETYTKAIALLLERTEKVLNPERERHQAIANATMLTLPPGSNGERLELVNLAAGHSYAVGAQPQGDVQSLATTPADTIVYIHGRKMRYEDDKVNKVNLVHCILAYDEENEIDTSKDLHPDGFAVLWGFSALDEWDLVWNHVDVPKQSEPYQAPFIPNFVLGLVIGPMTKIFDQPQGSVISCLPDGETLPAAVVEWSIRQLATENMAVVLPCGVNPVHVAELGRVPIFYEPDDAKFNQKVADLTAHYQSVIPNVKCLIK